MLDNEQTDGKAPCVGALSVDVLFSWPKHNVAVMQPLEDTSVWRALCEASEEAAFHPYSPTAKQFLSEAQHEVRVFNEAAILFHSGGSLLR